MSEKTEIPGVQVTPEALEELRVLTKRLEVSREASQLTGRDPNFYAGVINNIADLEIQKDKWMARQAELYHTLLPVGADVSIDLATGKFVY